MMDWTRQMPGMRRLVRLAVIVSSLCIAACGGAGAGGGTQGAAQGSAGGDTQGPAQGSADAGRVEQVQIPSTALHKTMRAQVYLPHGYSAAKRYPVLYLLYGFGGNEASFFGGFLAMHLVADSMLADGRINPMIIVVPDYANSFGVNTMVEQNPDSSGGTIGMYEDYLIQEIVPYVDGHYSTAAQREQRYIGGVSMGGFAALYLALTHPAMFSKVGAHSAALWDYGKTNADQFAGQRDWLYATPALRQQRDPMLLAQQVDLSGMRFYIDAGTGDLLQPKDQEMANILRDHGAAVEWHTSVGYHDQLYWNGQLANYLLFYAGVGR
ncbi:MAG: alpha/beta hydrolase [Telluria sp.]